MTRPRHQSKVGERGVDFSCPRCHVAGVKNSIPVWGRTEYGYICGKEKTWEVAFRDDPARRCQESLTSGKPTRRCSPGWTCTVWSETFHKSDIHGAKDSSDGEVEESRLNDDPTQTQKELAKALGVTQAAILLRLKEIGMIRRVGNWVPCELKPRDVECRFSREKLLQRPKKKKNERKGFLHRIVIGDERWVHHDYSKRCTTYGYPGRASSSTAKLNVHGGKIMLCIWWDQLGVAYYEPLQPNERITWEVYRRQLMRLNMRLIHKK
ncbi:hypothetical protein LAZ67_12003592 [Cordylochernes scorpioides]|uniref:Mariner Mos1 transposase n=1 Tax=Cordylochernes scorpioides TaxID=51811 RepID=A0ABY6L2G9_9ARAC|nr:hypothetical protein LAZ67_12003592 [Cordylochernes scorpioides]